MYFSTNLINTGGSFFENKTNGNALSEKITNAAKKIDEECEKINKNYIKIINNKLDTFELKLTKNVLKKMD